MEIFLSILFLVLGLLLLLKGGDVFVDKATVISKRLRIPPIIMGATIVSLATTMPELITCVISSAKGNFDLSIGNAVGSLICNTALITGITITAMPKSLGKRDSFFKYILLIFAMLVLILYGINRHISWLEGVGLLLIFVFFFAFNIIEARREMKKFGDETEREMVGTSQPSKPVKPKRIRFKSKFFAMLNDEHQAMWLVIVLFIVGAAAIGGGAYLLIEGATRISALLGIPEMIVGLTVVAIGTSLPELVTSITSLKRKNMQLGFGNIIGANILNISLLIGLSATISAGQGLILSRETLFITFPVALLCTLLLTLPVMFKSKTYRWQGISLLVIYILYIVYLCVSAALGLVI